jgi:CO/xanthine dehydrogenase FAD-binding subunit
LHELPEFGVRKPSTLKEALAYLSSEGRGSMLLAGGTSLIPRMRKRGVRVKTMIDLSGLRGLHYVRKSGNTIKIGGLTTISELVASGIFDERYRCFKALGHLFGSEATRSMATVAGNLAAGDEGDLVQILYALDGKVVVQSTKGERIAEPTNLGLAADEVIVEVQFPALDGPVSTWFGKFEKRKGGGKGIVTTAILVRLGKGQTIEDVRIVVSGARGRKIGRASKAESWLRGKTIDVDAVGRALDVLESEIEPTGDFRGSSRFRKEITRVMVKGGLSECLERLTGKSQIAGGET